MTTEREIQNDFGMRITHIKAVVNKYYIKEIVLRLRTYIIRYIYILKYLYLARILKIFHPRFFRSGYHEPTIISAYN